MIGKERLFALSHRISFARTATALGCCHFRCVIRNHLCFAQRFNTDRRGQNRKVQPNRCIILIGLWCAFTARAALTLGILTRRARWAVLLWCAITGCTVFTRCTVFTGGTVLTGPVIARTILSWPIFTGALIAWTAVAITVPIVIPRCAFARCITLPTITLSVVALTITGRTITGRTITRTPRCPADHVDRIERIFAIVAFGFIAIGACAVIVLPAVALIVALFKAAALLFFLAAARIRKHTEIMVGKLQIIFGHHPVARKLGVAGHVAIFFEQLGGIATRPAVDPVRLVGIATLATTLWAWTTIVVTPAPAAILLAIVHRHA